MHKKDFQHSIIITPSKKAKNLPTPKATRRQFLSTSVTATAALPIMASPLILNAEDKSGTKAPVVGSGEHTYRVIHHWGRNSLPSTHDYGNASHGVCIDRQGHVYITHTGRPDSVYVFDRDGRFVKSLAGFHSVTKGDASTSSGHGIDIRTEGNEEFIYLSASYAKKSFAKMSLKGELVWTRDQDQIFEHAGFAGKKLGFRPTNISFRPDGGYYLGDGYGSAYLYHYDAQDNFVKAIGGFGQQDGQFRTPHGQWLDTRDGNPKLVVADRANSRLQWFDMNGKHLRTQSGFLFPADIDSQGDLLLVPDLHARITILGRSNQPLAQLGDDEAWRKRVLDKKEAMRTSPEKWVPGQFVHPHDACFDADGNIFVTEWVRGGRVSKLVKV